MGDRIVAAREAELVRAAFHAVAAQNFSRQGLVVGFGVFQIHARQRAPNHGSDVWMVRLLAAQRNRIESGVGPNPAAFARRYEQVAATDCQCGGIPLRRDEVVGAVGIGLGVSALGLAQIEDDNRVGAAGGAEKIVASGGEPTR